MAKISVLGSGSWGLALALLLHNNGHEVLLWSARPENARKLREKRENPDRLPGVRLPDEIDVLTDLERALKDVDVTVLHTRWHRLYAGTRRSSMLQKVLRKRH